MILQIDDELSYKVDVRAYIRVVKNLYVFDSFLSNIACMRKKNLKS